MAQGSIVDVPTALIGLTSLIILWLFKIPEPLLIAAAAVAVMLLYCR
ncbi:MAG: hypothetical protein WA974_05640 [Thermodesulfobacteriota bacterium]